MLQPLAPARADSLGRVIDSVFAGREYRWEAREDPFGLVRRAWLATREWLFDLRDQNPEAFRVVVWGLVALLVLILLHAGWVAFSTVRAAGRMERRGLREATPEVRDARWYALEARRLADAGRFAEAIQADFIRLVLELDARQVARFHPSKTPGEYVREARLGDERRGALRDLVRALYAYAFARVPCDRAAFEAWHARAAADRFVEPAAASR